MAIPNSNCMSNHRLVAFTTPQNYAGRLSSLISLNGWSPIWSPTVIVEATPQTISSIRRYLSVVDSASKNPLLQEFSAVAFTSRTGISAFFDALDQLSIPPFPLSSDGEIFTISALGKDAELLDESFVGKLCENPARIKVLVPKVSTPTGLVESLGLGHGRKVLCPVPLVLGGLEEPPVVPKFLNDLAKKGWIAVRVNGYESRWAGPNCAEKVVKKSEEAKGLDAIVFTSSAEVEGFLKSLKELGLDWEMLKKRCPGLVVAAHGPVTASGAERLGVKIDVVSSKFDSFNGVVDALAYRWKALDI